MTNEPIQPDTDGSGSDDIEDQATQTDGEEATTQESGAVKVPEAFQKECAQLLSSCDSEACLDYLMDELTQLKHNLMSSQKKNHLATDDFDTEGMPTE